MFFGQNQRLTSSSIKVLRNYCSTLVIIYQSNYFQGKMICIQSISVNFKRTLAALEFIEVKTRKCGKQYQNKAITIFLPQ